MCMYSCVFVLISAHVGLGKTKSGVPWSARDEHAERGEAILDFLFLFWHAVSECGPLHAAHLNDLSGSYGQLYLDTGRTLDWFGAI